MKYYLVMFECFQNITSVHVCVDGDMLKYLNAVKSFFF